MGQINTNNYPTVDSLADADLLIVENAIHGTGTTTPKQLKEKAIGTDPLETTAQTVTGAINELKDAIDSGTGGAGRTLAGMGKEVSYSNQIITTDIEISRGPKVGDRFLIYFPDSCSNPRSLVINVNGTPTTLSWEIIGGDTYKGLCAIEVKAGMISDMALEKVWQEDELSAGTGISIVNNAIINTAPQLGENVGDRTYTTAITDGDLGSVTLSNDYVILNFKASAQPNSSTGKYFIQEAASSYHLYAALVDMAGNDFTDDIPAGTTLICKNKDGGDGTSADPYHVTVLGIGAGGGADELNDLSDVNISSPTNGQVLTYNGTSGKWGNNTNFEVDASGNVTASGDVTDGAGNVLSEVSALEITQSGNPIAVKAVGIKAKDVVVTLEPIQDLHGYGKPWAGGTYKNLLNNTAQSKTENGITWTVNSDGSVTAYGQATADTYLDTNTVLSGGVEMKVVGAPSGASTSTYYQQVRLSNPNGSWYGARNETGSGYTLSSAEVTASVKILVRLMIMSGTNISQSNPVIFKPMVTRDNTVTYATWTPYENICPISGRTQTSVTTRNEDNTESHTATISFGQTVYGGQVDFKTGVGIVDKAIIDTGNMSWSYNSSTGAMDSSISDIKRPISDNEAVNAICSVAKTIPASERGSSTSMDFYAFYNNNTVCVRRSGYTDAIAFTTAMTGQTICYELATPITIQLTPAMLELLKGYNYITADGNMEITLIPESIFDEAKAYTDSALADKTDNGVVGPVESGTTASQAYAVGEHFIRNDKFCTAIAAIASGATLTQGTNYVEGTIADNLYKRVNYSATEHVVGTWIDGSTLYEKTISCGQLPNSGPKYVDTGYTNNIKIVNIEMIAFNTDWMIYLPSVNPGSSNNNDDITVLHRRTYNAADSSMSYKLVILTGTDRSDYTESYCTIRYTKS